MLQSNGTLTMQHNSAMSWAGLKTCAELHGCFSERLVLAAIIGVDASKIPFDQHGSSIASVLCWLYYVLLFAVVCIYSFDGTLVSRHKRHARKTSLTHSLSCFGVTYPCVLCLSFSVVEVTTLSLAMVYCWYCVGCVF